MTPTRLEPAAPRLGVKHSTTEPLGSLSQRLSSALHSALVLKAYLLYVANNINPDQTAPKEQSDQGSYCLL